MTKSLASATIPTPAAIAASQGKPTALPVGSWSKRGGQAHYTISQDGAVTYTNRRGESSKSNPSAFLTAASQGFRFAHAVHGKPVGTSGSQVNVTDIVFEA